VCYAPLADPECPDDVLAIYAEQGVDIVEVGVPTADPYLDGVTVASSMRRVLRDPHPVERIVALVEAHANTLMNRCRVVLMGYQDMPFSSFTALARRNLIHGLIMADTSTKEEPAGLKGWLERETMKRIGFVDSALTPHLIERAREAGGYVMLQSHNGPTGVRAGLDAENGKKLQRLRRAGIDLPIALGFGIGSAEQAAAAIRLGADGIVVGSACIEAARCGSDSLRRFTGSLRRAINEAALNAASG
jgi:tryptophan synthase alpha chain